MLVPGKIAGSQSLDGVQWGSHENEHNGLMSKIDYKKELKTLYTASSAGGSRCPAAELLEDRRHWRPKYVQRAIRRPCKRF